MLRRAPGAVYEQLGDATLVLDAEHGTYVRLNGTGAFLWEALAEPVEEAALARALADRHGIDEARAGADVGAFVARLRERGLVVGVP
jgi:hypothetical protein